MLPACCCGYPSSEDNAKLSDSADPAAKIEFFNLNNERFTVKSCQAELGHTVLTSIKYQHLESFHLPHCILVGIDLYKKETLKLYP